MDSISFSHNAFQFDQSTGVSRSTHVPAQLQGHSRSTFDLLRPRGQLQGPSPEIHLSTRRRCLPVFPPRCGPLTPPPVRHALFRVRFAEVITFLMCAQNTRRLKTERKPPEVAVFFVCAEGILPQIALPQRNVFTVVATPTSAVFARNNFRILHLHPHKRPLPLLRRMSTLSRRLSAKIRPLSCRPPSSKSSTQMVARIMLAFCSTRPLQPVLCD